MKIKHFNELGPENGNNRMDISFSGVTLMRFRETAADACDPELINDDHEWKKRVIGEIGCIPPYWNNNTDDNQQPKRVCNSKPELELIKEYWRKGNNKLAKKVFRKYTKPCTSFVQLIINSIVRHDYSAPDILEIKIRLQDDFYEEIFNTRAISVADLWANIGGYVGIFCGYSLLQATSYLMANFKKCIIWHVQ